MNPITHDRRSSDADEGRREKMEKLKAMLESVLRGLEDWARNPEENLVVAAPRPSVGQCFEFFETLGPLDAKTHWVAKELICVVGGLNKIANCKGCDELRDEIPSILGTLQQIDKMVQNANANNGGPGGSDVEALGGFLPVYLAVCLFPKLFVLHGDN